MEQTEKLSNNKEIIAFLAEQFPACFSLKGQAKPLKIGIFDDVSKRLADDPRISKTRLRSALRQYTSSWRYLRSMKAGAARVDLDGNPCGELEQQHVEHSLKVLEESLAKQGKTLADLEPKRRPRRQSRPGERNGERNGERSDEQREAAQRPARANRAKRPATRKQAEAKAAAVQAKAAEQMKPVAADQLKAKARVNVRVGRAVMPGTIVELGKGDVQVQLDSGMQVRVKPDHIVS